MDASSPRSLVIRRTSPQGDRRRRVVIDPASVDEARVDPKTAGPVKPSPPRRYASAALPDQQLRWCDVIPMKCWTLAVYWVATLSWIAGLVGLDYLSRHLERLYPTIDLSPFHLQGPRTLADASQSLMLLASLLLCAGITHLRRYRIDDYRGHYRLGYYVTALACGVVLDQGTGILSSIDRWKLLLGPVASWLPSEIGWLVVQMGLLVAMAVRIFWEVRRSTATVFAMGLAVFAATTWRLVSHASTTPAPWFFPLGQQLASGATLMACVAYARFLVLDAQDLLTNSREANAADNRTMTPQVAVQDSAKLPPEVAERWWRRLLGRRAAAAPQTSPESSTTTVTSTATRSATNAERPESRREERSAPPLAAKRQEKEKPRPQSVPATAVDPTKNGRAKLAPNAGTTHKRAA